MIKGCEECGEPFEAIGNTRYCADECRRKRRKRMDRKYKRKNKTAHRDRQRVWRRKNPNQRRNGRLRRRYNITPRDYDRILESQGGGCAVCGQKKKSINLSVDHCHATGKIRGILCPACNRAIGMLGDTEEGLMRAVRYLQEANVGP